jgi:glycosyltransferase involved in cell wall biosynthesis
MKISYIVSVCGRSDLLIGMLASLAAQTDPDFEVIVTDNSVDDLIARRILAVCSTSNVPKIRYIRCLKPTCYHSAEQGLLAAKGDFVCFPSDDGYYMPKFGERMWQAAVGQGADLVLCNMVYDERMAGHYAVIDTNFTNGFVDKTGFLLRREKFVEFPGKPETDTPAACDGLLIEQLLASDISHAKIVDVLVVHS